MLSVGEVVQHAVQRHKNCSWPVVRSAKMDEIHQCNGNQLEKANGGSWHIDTPVCAKMEKKGWALEKLQNSQLAGHKLAADQQLLQQNLVQSINLMVINSILFVRVVGVLTDCSAFEQSKKVDYWWNGIAFNLWAKIPAKHQPKKVSNDISTTKSPNWTFKHTTHFFAQI